MARGKDSSHTPKNTKTVSSKSLVAKAKAVKVGQARPLFAATKMPTFKKPAQSTKLPARAKARLAAIKAAFSR